MRMRLLVCFLVSSPQRFRHVVPFDVDMFGWLGGSNFVMKFFELTFIGTLELSLDVRSGAFVFSLMIVIIPQLHISQMHLYYLFDWWSKC